MYSLTFSHVGIYVSDIEKHVRATPGFKPQAEWVKEIERKITQAGAQRRSVAQSA